MGDGNIFGQIGDNQLGAEVMGHSYNDRTRFSAAILSSKDGNVNFRTGNSYTGSFTASQAFDAGKLGVERLGSYAMVVNADHLLTTGVRSALHTRFWDWQQTLAARVSSDNSTLANTRLTGRDSARFG